MYSQSPCCWYCSDGHRGHCTVWCYCYGCCAAWCHNHGLLCHVVSQLLSTQVWHTLHHATQTTAALHVLHCAMQTMIASPLHLYPHLCLCGVPLSPPRHMAKLPSWSESWYCWYHCELAHHIYISYVDSLMSCLPLLCTPRFGSEEPCIPYVPYYHLP